MQVGLVFLGVLLGGIPGSKLGKAVTAALQSPVRSVMLCNVGFAASTGLAAGAYTHFAIALSCGGWTLFLLLTHRIALIHRLYHALDSFWNSRAKRTRGPKLDLHLWRALGLLPGLATTHSHGRLCPAHGARPRDGTHGSLHFGGPDLVLVAAHALYRLERMGLSHVVRTRISVPFLLLGAGIFGAHWKLQ